MGMNLFARLTKVDEEKRLVYGRATDETVDRAGEIFDYESSKPLFEKWSGEIAKATDGKSLGNLRAMHGNVSAGKLTSIDFVDAEKAIDICTKIVDDNEWNKVLEGCYTGFSIGGSYAKTWMDAEAKARRFTADPCEISIVDLPCNPSAGFFDIQKADGSVMQKAFKAPEPVTADAFSDEVAALAKDGGLSLDEMLAAIRLAKAAKEPAPIVDPVVVEPVAETVEPALTKAGKKVVLSTDNLIKAGRLAMTKGMDRVASFAWLLSSVQSLQQGSASEEAREGDDSTMPTELMDWLKQGGTLLTAMVTEEVAEMVDDEGNVCMPDVYYCEWAAAVDGLEKAAAEQADRKDFLQKVGARNSKADQNRIQAAHDLLAEMGAGCDPDNTDDDAEKAARAEAMTKLAAADESLQKLTAELASANEALVKAAVERDELAKSQATLTTEHEALAKAHTELTAARDELQKQADALTAERDDLHKATIDLHDKVKKLSSEPAYPKGSLRAVSKSADLVNAALQENEEGSKPVLKADGSVDQEATVLKQMKSVHRSGGVPLAR